MKIENIEKTSGLELLVIQSDGMSRTPVDTELQEQIYEELKGRSEDDRQNRLAKSRAC